MRHCDEYIDDISAPDCLRKFLDHARSPAHGAMLGTPRPKLFATWQGKRVQAVMASRFGDIGITSNLSASLSDENGYSHRVHVEELSELSATI